MDDTHTESTHALYYLILFTGLLSTSSGAIFVRLAQGQQVGSLEIAACRLLLSTIILLPVILIRYRAILQGLARSILKYTSLAGLFLAVHFATWILSLEYTSIASSVVLVSTTPIWVCIYSGLIKKETITSRTILGLVLALAGGVIVSLSETCGMHSGNFNCNWNGLQGNQPLLGNVLALVGAVMAAGYLLIGKKVRNEIPLTPYIFLVYGTGAILLVCASLLSGNGLLNIPNRAFLWLVCLAVIPQLIGHTSYNWSLKHFSTTYVSIALQGEPIGSTLLGILLLREVPTPVKVAGGLVILIGIVVVSWQQPAVQDGSIVD